MELRVCGFKQISVKGNDFSEIYSYIRPVADLLAGYCGVLRYCNEEEPEVGFMP